MTSVTLRVVATSTGLVPNTTAIPQISTPAIKVVSKNGVILTSPVNVPTVQAQSISNLDNYSTTSQMLANDATTYANAVAYINNAISNVYVASLKDVVVPPNPANNSTLVYNTANNKYTVQEMSLDGGNF